MLCQGSLKLYPVNLCAALVFSFEMNIVTLITIYGELKHYRFKLSWCIILSLINYYNDNISSRELLMGNWIKNIRKLNVVKVFKCRGKDFNKKLNKLDMYIKFNMVFLDEVKSHNIFCL